MSGLQPGTAGELERIHAAGGNIFSHDGVQVYGALNMPHSLGTIITFFFFYQHNYLFINGLISLV